MNNESTEILHPKFRMRLREDGIVQIVWAPAVVMDYEDALAATSAMKKLTAGRPHPLLVDAHAAGPLGRPARMEFASRGDLISAMALVANTPLSRLMGNFFIAVSNPGAPTRLFNDEASALAWLKEFAT